MALLDLSWNENVRNRFNSPLLPKSIRGLIVGKSGSGKTCLLLNLLLQPGMLDYNSLKIYGRSLFQNEYKIIKEAFMNNIPKECILKLFSMREEILNNNEDPINILKAIAPDIPHDQKSDIQCEFYEDDTAIPDPKDLNKTRKNLFIFDDLQLEKQNTCEKYYVRGRHSNVDTFYLAQNYFKLPRQTIRENANFICLFKQDNKNLNHLYEDHVAADLGKDEFKSICKYCWDKPHGFVTIDLSSDKYNGKYRCMLDEFYIPN